MLSLNKRLEVIENHVLVSGLVNKQSAAIGVCDLERNVIDVLDINGDSIDSEPEILIPEKLKYLLTNSRYKTTYGGRGSAKTRTIVSLLVEKSRIKFERILCCREIQKSIDSSSYQEIVDEIERRCLSDEFVITDKYIKHKSTGSTFKFEGLYRNQTKIKGYAGATIVWVEEAESVSLRSWDFLVNTIRAKGSEVWTSFNPANNDDPTYTERVKPFLDLMDNGVYVGDENSASRNVVIKINYSDNPWFPDELEGERITLMQRDYDRYLWVYEGEFFDRKEAQVFSGKWEVKEFDVPDNMIEFYHGMDFGFANDPSAVTRSWIKDECLYIDYESGGVGVPLDDHGKLIDKIPTGKMYDIQCDCARPETINHLQRMGYKTKSAPKWSGSVEDGIEFIRSFKRIYIHPRCKETAKEFSKYSYKVNKLTDEVLPQVEDANNHYIDSIRYGLSKLIKNRGEKIETAFTIW